MRGGDGVEQQISREAPKIERARHIGMLQQRSKLRAEHEHARAVVIVERLLAHSVARQQELPLRSIPEREGEHAVQVGHELFPVLLVGVHQHFGVRLRGEPVPASLEP